MNILANMRIIIILLIFIISVTGYMLASKENFTDNFDNFEKYVWNDSTGTWHITDGKASCSDICRLLFGEWKGDKYILYVDISANQSRIRDYAGIGIYIYYEKPEKYVIVGFADDNREGYVDLVSIEAKGVEMINTKKYIYISDNHTIEFGHVTQNIKVIRLNKNVYVYFNNRIILTTEFEDENLEGNIGFFTYESTGYFDNFNFQTISDINSYIILLISDFRYSQIMFILVCVLVVFILIYKEKIDIKLSNYPIIFALILLMTVIMSIFIEDRYDTESIAIYAYYFLVIGTIIRSFEFVKEHNLLSLISIYKYDYRPSFVKLKKNTNKYYIIIIYISLSFLILFNVNRNYLLLLDMIFPIKKSLDDLYFSSFIYGGNLLPSIIELISTLLETQRIYLLLTIFLSGYLMHCLFCQLSQSRITNFYVGLFYILNPYAYIRIMSGQLYLLFSYAILPLLLKFFIDLLERRQKKEFMKFVFALSIVAFNIHMLIISLIIMSIIFLFWFNKYRDIRITKLFTISGILFILLNSYWIIPVLTAKNTIVDNITDKDIDVFAPKGSLFDIAAMYGFWREGYIYAKDFIPGWQILYLIILSLAIIGFLAYYKDEKIGYLVKAIGVIGIIGFILASGIKGPFGDQIYWLYDNTILKGFRDSHKFVSMMVLTYAILGGLGINKILNYERNP